MYVFLCEKVKVIDKKENKVSYYYDIDKKEVFYIQTGFEHKIGINNHDINSVVFLIAMIVVVFYSYVRPILNQVVETKSVYNYFIAIILFTVGIAIGFLGYKWHKKKYENFKDVITTKRVVEEKNKAEVINLFKKGRFGTILYLCSICSMWFFFFIILLFIVDPEKRFVFFVYCPVVISMVINMYNIRNNILTCKERKMFKKSFDE